jgi:hypothetical protein
MSYKKALEIEPASRRTGLVNIHLLKKKAFLSEDEGHGVTIQLEEPGEQTTRNDAMVIRR